MPEHTDHLFVVSRRHQYIGRLAVSALLTHDPGTPINELIDDEQPANSVGTPADSVANQFSDHDWGRAPVVDANKLPLGRITIADVIAILRAQAHHTGATGEAACRGR